MKKRVDDKLFEQMVSWRHHLHQNPEIAMQEKKTAAFIAAILHKLDYTVSEGIGGTGVIGSLCCGTSNQSIGLRADMDALPLPENTKLPYASTNGKMHACGHDGHMTMLLGAAALLSENRNFNGTVHLIFQPGEEATLGAKAMIKDKCLERFPLDEIYGLHNVPFYPHGTFSTRVGGLMSSEDNFKITIKGSGGHASTPHEGVDPLLCFAQIYPALQMIVSREINPTHPVVISCTEITTDGARNAIPATVEITGDVRCFRREDQEHVEHSMQKLCKAICTMNGATCNVEYTHECSSIINNEFCVAHACEAAQEVVGHDKVNCNCEPWMASEDFSYFLKQRPGCFILLGTGQTEKEHVSLHSPFFDFDDSVLPIGAAFWETLVAERLQ